MNIYGSYSDPTPSRTPTSKELIDKALDGLQSHKDQWVRVPMSERIALLDQMLNATAALGEEWVRVSLSAKAATGNPYAEGEEWSLFGGICRYIRLLRQSLAEVDRYGRPQWPATFETQSNGQVVAQVFPRTWYERMLLPGMRGEVWLEPGMTAEGAFKTQGSIYRNAPQTGKVALVLGAGNVGAIVAADILHKVFVELQVVILKMNPVNAYLGRLFEEGFQALMQQGVLRIVHGGAAEGTYLCHHPWVDTIHMTGSDKTFETIVFGSSVECTEPMTVPTPRLSKPITAELGSVNPVIVVPGPWSKKDVERQALALASWMNANVGFACLNPRLLIQHQGWAQRSSLLEALGSALAEVQARHAYYPGAAEQHTRFIAAHPEAQHYGTSRVPGSLPWTLITHLDPHKTDDMCFNQEAFCPILAETALEAHDAAAFVRRATQFANQQVWGSLCATLLVHPKSLRDPQLASAVEEAIANLRYGTICINVFAGLVYTLGVTPWGAFPGHSIHNIQSGLGKVHNPYLLSQPEKAIFRAPFRKIDPVSVKSKHYDDFGKRYAEFNIQPSFSTLFRALGAAIKS